MSTVHVSICDPARVGLSVSAEAAAAVHVSTAPVQQVVGGSPYTGPYTVTPDVSETTLPTRYKTMQDDVRVLKIPLWETSNAACGTTITIGGDKYYGLQ